MWKPVWIFKRVQSLNELVYQRFMRSVFSLGSLVQSLQISWSLNQKCGCPDFFSVVDKHYETTCKREQTGTQLFLSLLSSHGKLTNRFLHQDMCHDSSHIFICLFFECSAKTFILSSPFWLVNLVKKIYVVYAVWKVFLRNIPNAWIQQYFKIAISCKNA